MWDRMSPLDAAFLDLEDADPHASLAISSTAVLDGPAPSHDEFMTMLRGRLPLIDRYRQKARQIPLDLGRPVWVDDPDFDLAHHVRRTALPAPGDDEALSRLVGRVMSQRLDRDHPLWEYWIVEGLAGGRWALISKVHHCMVDGISGTHLYHMLCDESPDTDRELPADTWSPAAEPSTARLLADALVALATNPIEQVRLASALIRAPRAAVTLARDTARGLGVLARAVVSPSGTALVGPIGRQRRYAFGRVPLADMVAIRRRTDTSFNDVALAAIATGFRQLLVERGEDADAHAVRSLVPVSVRVPGEEGIYENRLSLMLAYLPVDVDDPVERLTAVHRHLTELKSSREAQAAEAMTALSTHEPFPPISWGVRLAAHLPQWVIATVTTNVPGPRRPLFLMGRRVLEILPYVPIAARLRIGVSIFTYCDQVTFGVTGDFQHAPEVDALASAIVRGVAELVTAHQPTPQPAAVPEPAAAPIPEPAAAPIPEPAAAPIPAAAPVTAAATPAPRRGAGARPARNPRAPRSRKPRVTPAA
jgi:diacylglycerol O-acyltransferase